MEHTTTKGAATLISQSRTLLSESLMRLMERDEFHKITVLQLCQEAGLSRRTFYRHFTTKEDVLRHLLRHMRREFMERYDIAHATLEEEITYSFAYFDRHRDMLKLFHRHHLFYLIKEMLEDYMRGACTQEFARMLGQPEMEQYFDSYFAGSMSAVLELWVRNGFDKRPEELALFTRHLHGGV